MAMTDKKKKFAETPTTADRRGHVNMKYLQQTFVQSHSKKLAK